MICILLCKKEFLDMFVFERTGGVEFKEGRFQFTEPRPTQLPKKFYARSGAPTISAKPIDIMWIKAHNSGKFCL